MSVSGTKEVEVLEEKYPRASLDRIRTSISADGRGQVFDNVDNLQRRLGNRQIQLIAIGGSIGTGLFVTIGGGLARGGPGSMFLAFTIYCIFIGFVNNCMAEMSTLMPVSGGFVRMAGKWVDEALGFMVGWNFFLYEALIIPFEITAFTIVLGYWSSHIPAGAICAAVTVLYGFLNIMAVGLYGEAEFWLSSGKVFLVLIVYSFTFITMVGGNPKHDAYGFRYWNNPGAFAEHHSTGDVGRFEGFLSALWSASFIIVGPEYISMAAAEVMRPRTYLKTAFKTVYWRFAFFFIGGALCVGIIVPYNDPTLVAILSGKSKGGGTAAASPYVIAMAELGISVLPHITNALLCTSIFSAGNTYTYCAIRSLYGLSLEGRAPKIFQKCTKGGVPWVCFIVVMCFPLLSFLQLSSGSSVVLNWLVNLVTAGCVIDYIVMCATYLFFYRACKAQGIDRRTFPYYGYFQPYSAWLGLIFTSLVVIFYGYSSFTPWSVESFFIYYAMVIVAILTFTFWKIIKKTKLVPAHEVDLVWERPQIDAYESTLLDPPTTFWGEILDLFTFKSLRTRGRKSEV